MDLTTAQWTCFGNVSLTNDREHAKQLLCRLLPDLTSFTVG